MAVKYLGGMSALTRSTFTKLRYENSKEIWIRNLKTLLTHPQNKRSQDNFLNKTYSNTILFPGCFWRVAGDYFGVARSTACAIGYEVNEVTH